MFIVGAIIFFLLGVLIMNLYLEEEKRVNSLLKKTINNLEDDIDIKDSTIKDYQEENVILLNNSAELRSKVTDLENNIELLTNNLSEENKELVDNLTTEN